eukprot:scaffold223969_cov30-Tisochrysis_lutea.AAC.10
MPPPKQCTLKGLLAHALWRHFLSPVKTWESCHQREHCTSFDRRRGCCELDTRAEALQRDGDPAPIPSLGLLPPEGGRDDDSRSWRR